MEFNAPPLFRHLAIALLAATFVQCSQDEPDNKALINCDISLFSNAAMQGKVTINQALINLNQIQVTGTQPSLSTSTFTKALSADDGIFDLMDPNSPSIRVDAERNDYDPLSLTLTLGSDSNSPQIENTAPNIESYLQSAKPAFLISARFDNRGRAIPIYVAFPAVSPLKSMAEQYGSVRVKIDVENVAEIQLNPGHLFDGLTTQQLEGATKATYQNQEVIFIHPNFNGALYDILLSRLEDAPNSMKVKVKVTRSLEDK